MSLKLSPATLARVEALFSESERDQVIKILEDQCGSNLPFFENITPESSERIRFAALKLSCGEITKLQRAVDIAKEDWRDVLVAAGFGHNVTIHELWWPAVKS